MNKSNIHKKLTHEDKFGRHFYCEHARLNLVRSEKRKNKRKFRRMNRIVLIDTTESL